MTQYDQYNKTIFITGSAGFIGSNLVKRLFKDVKGANIIGIDRVMQGTPERKKGEHGFPIPPYSVYNIDDGQPKSLLDFVQILQEELVRACVFPADFDFKAHKKLVPMQPGDVPTTYADATALERDFGFTPKITLREGLRHFAEWYKQFYDHE